MNENKIEFVQLSEIDEDELVDLMNNELVGKLLPLLSNGFSKEDCRSFLGSKKQLWDEYGYGPWAFLINGGFAGWGGLQPEHGDADFALVLHPDYWGWGAKIFRKVKNKAFNEMNLESITILLPPSRPNSKAIARLGFKDDGQLIVDSQTFLRFRLTNPHA